MVRILAVEKDPFAPLREGRDRLVRRPQDFPFKAVGSNVILREVKVDVASLLVERKSNSKSVLRLGEVQSVGAYWTMNRVWYPPIPQQRRTPLLDGSWDADWKPEVIPEKPRLRPPIWTQAHADRFGDIKQGDLVIYNNARVYDTFTWQEQDFLIYPGCWIHAVVVEGHLADNPDLRRYDHAEL